MCLLFCLDGFIWFSSSNTCRKAKFIAVFLAFKNLGHTKLNRGKLHSSPGKVYELDIRKYAADNINFGLKPYIFCDQLLFHS